MDREDFGTFAALLVTALFGAFFFVLIFGGIDKASKIAETKETTEKNTEKIEVSISESIYSNEEVDFTISEISEKKIKVIADYVEGEDHEYTYSNKKGSIIKLKGVDETFEVKYSSQKKGVLELYVH